ncbi:MAG: hypothetical protein AAF627_11895 [Myxococcota bacterium]
MLERKQLALLAFSFLSVACSESDDSSNAIGDTDTGTSPTTDMADQGVLDGGLRDEDLGTPHDMTTMDAGLEVFELVGATPDPAIPLQAEMTITFRFEFSQPLEDAPALVLISEVRPNGQSGSNQFPMPDGSVLELDPLTIRADTTRLDFSFQALQSESGEALMPGGLLEDDFLTLSYSILNMGGS